MNGRGLHCQKEDASNCMEKRKRGEEKHVGKNEIKAETCGRLREKGKQRTKEKSIQGQDKRRRGPGEGRKEDMRKGLTQETEGGLREGGHRASA